MPGQTPIAPGQALAIAELLFPDGELVIMRLPIGPDGVYDIGKRAPDEVGNRPYRHVWIDQYSGAVRYVQDPHRGTAGDKFVEWQFPLHTGEAFGLPGRILGCIAGLVPTVLYVTGFIRWRKRPVPNAAPTLELPSKRRARARAIQWLRSLLATPPTTRTSRTRADGASEMRKPLLRMRPNRKS